MEIKTINPILVNPTDTTFNGYSLANSNNIDLQGREQDVNTGDFTIKGVNPVFEGDKEISRNEFLFAEPVEFEDETLTPMDEFLYSNVTGEERKARRDKRKADREAARKKASQTTPGNGEPSKEEQDAKAKEGKFWNVLKGGWDNFTKSASGQIILDSATTYLSNKLNTAGGNEFIPTTDGNTSTDEKKDDESKMSPALKYSLIGGGVLLVGIIIYFAAKKK